MRYDPDLPFGPSIMRGPDVPFVVGQIGQTLDGRVATPTGKSLYINGKCALQHLHRLRAEVDALIVGVGTVIADDPRLTVRLCEGKSPVRVVVDPDGRVPPDALCLTDDGVETILVHRTGVTGPGGRQLLLAPQPDGIVSPRAILDALGALGLRRVLVEGGPTTLSHFLDAGVLDELHVMVAPKIFGSGREGITLPPIDTLDQALNPVTQTRLFADGDVLFQCDLSRSSSPA